MPETAKCASCGVEIPPGMPSGQCPKCLLGLGLAEGQEAPLKSEDRNARGPRHFADYELTRQIGCGGMGVVYEALQTSPIRRSVALKLILDAQACSPVARRRFLIEAEAAARLDHPNIVPIYEVGEFEDQLFFSMKLVQGETLQARMARGELGPSKDGDLRNKAALAERQRTAVRLVRDVARAVDHAHTQNVLHRDLTPANILIEADGTPQLTDFGLAKILDGQQVSVTEPGMIQGTVPYMPPEQVRGQKVSAAADTYSLGVILFELLAGEQPFRGTTPLETMRLIEHQPPTLSRRSKARIDRDLRTICLKCLEKNPGNRYNTTAELVEDLDRWLNKQPIKARPAGPLLRTGRWIARNPLGTALIASLLFGLLMSIAYLRRSDMATKAKLKGMADNQFNTERLLQERTQRSWEQPGTTNMVFAAEELANLWSVPFSSSGTERYVLAFTIRDNPVESARGLKDFFLHLQTKMSHALDAKVIFDLKFCKNYYRHLEVAGGGADFQYLGVVPFWRARDLSPGLQPVVQDRVGKSVVIVVASNSSISQVSQLAGRSVAFPDTNSTIGLWMKTELAKAGIRGSNLASFETIDDQVPIELYDALGSHQGSRQRPGAGSGVEAARRVLMGPLFQTNDFLDVGGFANKLRERWDPASQFLWSKLSSDTQRRLTADKSNSVSSTLMEALTTNLNNILTNVLYDDGSFAGVSLSAETRALSRLHPQGEDLIRFNRGLLQDAYPLELAKRQQIDATVLQEKYFELIRYRKPGLRAIARTEIIPNLWAARAGLTNGVVTAFQQAMLDLNRQPEVLKQIPILRAAQGFQAPTFKDLDWVRDALANEARQFEASVSTPPAK